MCVTKEANTSRDSRRSEDRLFPAALTARLDDTIKLLTTVLTLNGTGASKQGGSDKRAFHEPLLTRCKQLQVYIKYYCLNNP
jgi:hypothetical protein